VSELTIAVADSGWVAHLRKKDVDWEMQLLFPLADVRVQTFGEGILVIGLRLNPWEKPEREVRQAWYCLPVPRA
jgi:hypothetical protein